ncbi:transglutaminaseTgpA domain-containing protein [Pseudofrankia sp. BMG5.37]|uniref:transglutaminaseTgpA domain-containing protein n=1 Tax=Pseudofrankia sp. BMG5.37 TaxID=3050035 RepID=UPI002894680E|nr:transglutaminaseTgpA domain-containing protein [Pseudofrankia sp. BMG5.37]MDT3445282.1 transglutaminaseTgpA domain-containing protein [Pseudofrankia sp. BMG5.37]
MPATNQPGASAGRRRTALLGAGRSSAQEQWVPTAVGAFASLMCALALTPLFRGLWWWFGPALLAVLVVVGLAALGRRAGLGPSATIVLSLAGLLLTLTGLCTRAEAWLGFIPNGASLARLTELMSDGRSDMSRLAAPVPSRPGLVVLTVLGVALVALVVDLLTVAARRPTLAGLPLLGLFAVPAAVLPGGVGVAPFALGVLGFLALLMLDGRSVIGRWGRLVTTHGQGRSQLLLGGLAGRVAFGAVLLAVLVPVVTPSLNGNGLVNRDKGAASGNGPGSSQTKVSPPMATLTQRLHDNPDRPVMTVLRPNDPDAPLHLRQVALDDFDGSAFNMRQLEATTDDRIEHGLPGPPAGLTITETVATISIKPGYPDVYLPVPGLPTSVKDLTGDWRLDRATGTIFAAHANASGITYTVTAATPAPTPRELTAGGPRPPNLGKDVMLPKSVDPRVGELARQIAQGRSTDYDKVRAIQDYFRGGTFTYDLNGAPTNKPGALAEFLFGSKRGYCEQFASAMTVLVRSLGIPARVAVGFVDGIRQADGSRLIRNGDAHAWPEVWLPGTGWIAFEPTPRTDGATPAPNYAPDPGQAPAGQGTSTPGQTQPATPTPGGSQPGTTESAGPADGPQPANPEGRSTADLADSLRQTDLSAPRLSVRTADPAAFKNVFLRETALDTFDGERFTSVRLPGADDTALAAGLPGPAAGVATTAVTATVAVHPGFHETELPVPGVPASVTGLEGDWWLNKATSTLYATVGTSAAGATYTVQSQIPTPTAAQRAATGAIPAELAVDRALPATIDPRVESLARELTANYHRDYDKVSALERYLRGPTFAYDQDAVAGTLANFLFGTKRGFCVDYATAMAAMARSLDIPARVVTGFAFGVPQADGTLLYKDGNRHAWTEVWLPGTGWIGFNPTPVGELRGLGDSTWSPGSDQHQSETGQQPAATATPGAGAGTGGETGEQGGTGRAAHIALWVGIWLVVALAALGLLFAPAIARRVIRRRRLRVGPRADAATADTAGDASARASARVRAGWAELLDVSTDLGIPLRPSDSPRMVVARLSSYLSAGPEADDERVVAARAALGRIGWAEERVRYAPPGTPLGEGAGTIGADVTTAIDTLLAVAPRSRRLVAQVAPPSVLRRLTRSGAYAADERAWQRRSVDPASPPAAGPAPGRESAEPPEPAGRS